MPFKSETQRKWMHVNKPEMAKDWEKKLTYSDRREKKEKKMKKETKVRGIIKRMVREIMAEAPRPIHHSQAKALQVWKNHIPKVQKILKKLVAKAVKFLDFCNFFLKSVIKIHFIYKLLIF